MALASCGQRKEGIIFALIHSYLAWETALTPTCVKSPENRHDPYRDTVENGSTLGKPDIHDPQLDPKAQNLTPKNRKIDALQNSRSGRLCRPL